MQTDTIERTDSDERVDDSSDSDRPKHFHYVKKDKIAECGDGHPRGGVVRGGVPGDEIAQTGLTGLPGLQADLRDPQAGLTGSRLVNGRLLVDLGIGARVRFGG